MVDGTIENAALVRRTLVMAGAMVGACVAVVGTLTLAAVLVVGHAVGSSTTGASNGGVVPPGAVRTVPVAGIGNVGAPGAQRK
jgi:hypothetical protein